jgi:hypothetical protein
MRRFSHFISWLSSSLWSLFKKAPLWVKIALGFLIIMKINGNIAVSLIMIGVCFWAIQYMFRSLIPKKGEKK